MTGTTTSTGEAGVTHTCVAEVRRDEVEAFAAALGETRPARPGPSGTVDLAPLGYVLRVAAEAAVACVHPLMSDPLLTGLLQVAHDQEFERLLEVGEVVTTTVRLTDRWAVPGGSLVTLAADSTTDRGPVSRARATLLVGGIESPARRLGGPRPTRQRTVPRTPMISCGSIRLTERHARDYAEAAGDPNPIHSDAAAARAAGHPGIVVPGMCLLWLTTSRVLERFAAGDPRRVAALSCRFTAPGLPGDDARVMARRVDERTLGFRLDGPHQTILKSGLLTLRGTQP